MFTTKSKCRIFEKSPYWIMGGTFKTVPTLFRQFYTIHSMVRTEENLKILPRVYALMTSKSE